MNEKVANAASESIVSRTKGYVADSIDELKKVHSPTRQEAMKLTGVVLLIIAFISLCLFVMDLSFNWLMGKMLSR
jgi:preprotein translocase SecE subunit